MRLWILILILAVASVATRASGPCDSLDACTTELRAMATRPDVEDGRMDESEDALLIRMRGFDGAVPRLVALLSDPDKRVASMAAKGLRDASQIDPVYLPEIIAGLDRDLGWLAPALGHMPSDAAAREAVKRLLVSDSAPHNQEAYAVELSGERAIPFIVEAARCSNGCGEQDHYYLGHVLGEMERHRALAAPGLMALAEDDSISEQAVRGALSMITRLGPDGASLEARLRVLRERKPELADAVDEALIGIGSTLAGDIFAERLRKEPNVYLLRDLAEAGHAGRASGPVLIELLGHPDWEVRQGAARALGFIGYELAADALVPLLDEPTDVRLNWIAAESLGRMRAKSAELALQRAAESHWFPAVREAAATALAAIRTGKPYENRFHRDNFAFEFFSYQSMAGEMPACRTPELRIVKEPRERKLHASTDSVRLAKLAYASTIVSYGAVEDLNGTAKPGEVIELTSKNTVEHRQVVSQTPDVALSVDNGWLVGSDRGEWGGELAFIGDDGLNQTILEKNVEDIYQLDSRLIAVTGLAHMFVNEAMLYEVARDAEGKWSARPWRVLPSAPGSSWLVPTGELQVNSHEGVSVLVNSAGAMRMAPCRRYEKQGSE